MGFSHYIRTVTSLFLFSIFIVGCSLGQSDMEGYVLEVKENELLVAQDISEEKYDEIKDTSINDLHHGNLPLIYLSYQDAADFKKGNEIEIWLDGDIQAIHPGQAKAKKIELKE